MATCGWWPPCWRTQEAWKRKTEHSFFPSSPGDPERTEHPEHSAQFAAGEGEPLGACPILKLEQLWAQTQAVLGSPHTHIHTSNIFLLRLRAVEVAGDKFLLHTSCWAWQSQPWMPPP